MAEQSTVPSPAVVRRRPSSAGDLVAVRHKNDSSVFWGNAEDRNIGANAQNTISAERERPVTAPSGGLRRAARSRTRRQPPPPPPSAAAGHGNPTGAQGEAQRWQQPKRERGVSARAVEARLDRLRADDDERTEFLTKVNGIIERRSLHEHGGLAWAKKTHRSSPKTRKAVQRELRRAYPLDTERKADLVELLRSGGLEANRATQTLLDAQTKAVLTRRANEGRRARETRIRHLVSACRKLQRDRQLAVREDQALKDQKIRAGRERARQAHGQTAQIKGWLTALKMHMVIVWVANGLGGIEEEKRKSEAARIITRHVVKVARHRFKLRVEAATRVIDNQFAKKIRRWKTKRDTQATAVLKRFLTDVKSSGLRTKVKLLAYRVAHAHVQLARLQRWWRRRRQEMAACRRVMCRLWEQEVDWRVDAKVDEILRARNEAASLGRENSYMNHRHHSQIHYQMDVGGAGLNSSGTLRWGTTRHTPTLSPGGGGPVKEVGHGAATAKGKSARQAREEQARGERATIRYHLLLDPLMNPPADLKVRMCSEYLRQMARRHAGAVGEFEQNTRRAVDTPTRAAKTTGMPSRPRWRTGALPGEVPALVDAGIEYILGMRWLWEPQTPSRLDDGTLVADSLPSPEELAVRVASTFRYGGKKLAMLFQKECASSLGIKGVTAITSPGRFGSPEQSGASQSAAQAGYAPAAAGWIGEAAAGSMSFGGKKRVAPLLTYHYLPPSSSSHRAPADKNGS